MGSLNASHVSAMNRKQRRMKQSLEKIRAAIHLLGRSYTIEEAWAFAAQEQAKGNFQAAVDMFSRILIKIPDNAEAYNARGIALKQLKRYDDALTSYNKAVALKPDFAEAHNNRGNILHEMKLYDESVASYDKAILFRPNLAEAYFNRGRVLVNMGNMTSAEAAFLKAVELKPDFADPLFNLANMRKYNDTQHAHVKKIKSLLHKRGSILSREYLYFSLGKIYDDCGRYNEAFECYGKANRLCNSTTYNPEAFTQNIDRITSAFSKDFLAQKFSVTSQSKTPLFIVGMPRSGTTLMASILSNHPSIATAGELPTIINLTSRLPEITHTTIPYPQAAKQLTPANRAKLIREYEKRLKRDVDAEMPYIIDKHPINFIHLGFISMLFPKAHIIHCTRNPLDTCLSNYFQRFSMDYDYSFDLRNIGHFYGEYARIMDHWRGALPSGMIEIRYEDMVMNTRQVATKVLGLLGLAWDERCLSPHTNPCAVDTASHWQVRQPIYKESIGRWRHYEKQLLPLMEMLNSIVERKPERRTA